MLLSQRHIMFSDPSRRYFAKTRQVKYSGMKERPESMTMLTIFHEEVYVLLDMDPCQSEVCSRQTNRHVSVHFWRDSTTVWFIKYFFYKISKTYAVIYYYVRQVMFCLSVFLFVSISRITQKVVHERWWFFLWGWNIVPLLAKVLRRTYALLLVDHSTLFAKIRSIVW